MRKVSVTSLFVLLALPMVAPAQSSAVAVTGGVSAGVGAPITCEGCEDFILTRAVGVQIRNRFGIGYRGVRWGDQRRSSTSRMSSDLLVLDLHWPTSGRLRPFVSGGLGLSSARVKAYDGGHAYNDFGPASSVPTTFWGLGLDVRLFRRLSLTPMISSLGTTGAESKGERCVEYNYLSGDFTPTCSQSSERYRLSGFSLGIGIR